MILSCSKLNKAFGDRVILKDASFHVDNHDKCALIGDNGAGKTTLLKMLMGEEPCDGGQIVTDRSATVGYLAQYGAVDSDRTLLEEVRSTREDILDAAERLEKIEKTLDTCHDDSTLRNYDAVREEYEKLGGYAYESEVRGILQGLGFSREDWKRTVNTLSGGQKTRLALGKLLLYKPDLIILDEPTNHLDTGSIAFLENFLQGYTGAVLVVSHDRYFLDRVVNRVFEVEAGNLRVFKGNYTEYARQKRELMITLRRAYDKQQAQIAHQEAVIEKLRSFNREKSIKRAESREKALAKIEVMDKPVVKDNAMGLKLNAAVKSGEDVLDVQKLTMSFGERILFDDLSLSLQRGEHVGIIGDNGTGKTTILKIITGGLEPDSGEIRFGTNVEVGFYDQEQHLLNEENDLFGEISDAYPYMNNTDIRSCLAAFLFTDEEVFKEISALSGGERGRMALLKLMLSDSNFLILDEPTNHLDIRSREVLEEALNDFEGTVLFVSHDRYFLNKCAHRIYELEKGSLMNYLGNYDYYLEKKGTQGNFTGGISGSKSSEKDTNDKNSFNNNSESNTENKFLTSASKTVSGNVSATSESDSGSGSETSKENAKESYARKKALEAKRRKQANDIKKCEDAISELEDKIKQLDEEISKPENAVNQSKLMELTTSREALSAELEEKYELWEELSTEM